MCLLYYYEKIAGAGGGNYEEIVGFHNPKDIIADYRDFDEDPHNRNQNQHDGYHKQWLDTVLGQAVNGEPKKVSADQDPKGVFAEYPKFRKDSYDRSSSHHKRGDASEEKHFGPPKLRSGTRGIGKDFPDKKEADSAGLIRFAIAAGNAYFEAMLKKPIELPPDVAKAFVKDMRTYFAEKSAIKRDIAASGKRRQRC